MPSQDRRAAGRRRAWGRGPMILRFDSLESRELLSATGRGLPDLVASQFYTTPTADMGDSIQAVGQITNQGRAATKAPFKVDIFASSSTTIGRYAQKIGEFEVPAGLDRNQSVPFNTTIKLPSTALPGMGSTNVVYIALKVDPEDTVRENNPRNNSGVGAGYDVSAVTIAPHPSAKLLGNTLSVSSTDVTWGDSVTVTAQVVNNGPGDAPATRARLVLTPSNAAVGGTSDVTIADVAIPEIKSYQAANVVQTITLPSIPPSDLTGSMSFTLSLVQDSDYLTNKAFPHQATQGTNLDQTAIRIVPTNGTNPPIGARADLAASSVTTSSTSLVWGQSVQLSTTVQNIGTADAKQFRVFFVLVGASGSLTDGIYLGQAIVPELKAGFDQQIIQDLQLPSRLPSGLSLSSIGKSRIAVVIDPENVIDEPVKTNNTSQSAPIVLKVIQTNGTSKTADTPTTGDGTTPSTTKQTRTRKLYHKAPKKTDNSVLHKLSVFPSDVGNFLKKYF